MRVSIVAVGRLKDGPERALYDHYVSRFEQAGRALALGPIETSELPESRAASKKLRTADEAQRIIKSCTSSERWLVLDPNGRSIDSPAFANQLAKFRDDGAASCAFLIGGPDGHGREVLDAKRSSALSLGAMTLPHGLARVVLAEQLYRAATILSGHPYHRG